MNRFFIIILALILSSCGGTELPLSPIKKMESEFSSKEAYTILLEDMDLKEDLFVHKYKTIEVKDQNNITINTTEWIQVDEHLFHLHENDLGMEILSKKNNGEYNHLITPPGFTNFINDPSFGEWSDTTSSAVWVFYSSFENLEEELKLKDYPVTRTEYDIYINQHYRNRPFYGALDKDGKTHRYGTSSNHWILIMPNFYYRRKMSNNFYKTHSSSNSNRYRGGGGYGK